MANKLIERIAEKGYSLEAIAGELVTTPEELERKINREVDFLYSEICYLRNLLNLSSKEVDSFFFGDGQGEEEPELDREVMSAIFGEKAETFDEETERQNERRNFHLIANLKTLLEGINSNNTRLASLLDLLSRCSDEGMGYDSISLNEIALNLARENNRLLDEAERECYEAY